MNNSTDTNIIATAPIVLMGCNAILGFDRMLAYKLYPVTKIAAIVVTYMNSMGQNA